MMIHHPQILTIDFSAAFLVVVTAALAVGSDGGHILFRHVFPNSLPLLVVQAMLGVATSVIEIAALGFLGLGAQPPTPEWGAMPADSYKY